MARNESLQQQFEELEALVARPFEECVRDCVAVDAVSIFLSAQGLKNLLDALYRFAKSVPPLPGPLLALEGAAAGTTVAGGAGAIAQPVAIGLTGAQGAGLLGTACMMGGPRAGNGGSLHRPGQRPSDAPSGTRAIDEHAGTRNRVHRIKQNLAEDGVGPESYVGISPAGDVIVTNVDGTAANLGSWRMYAD